MGFSPIFGITPLPLPRGQSARLDIAHDGLTAFMHHDTLNPNHLGTFAALAVQGLQHVSHASGQVGAVLLSLAATSDC